MFNFKHFTSLQWFGFGCIINCLLIILSYFTSEPAPWFITVISVLLAAFSIVFIAWPSKDGFKSQMKKEP